MVIETLDKINKFVSKNMSMLVIIVAVIALLQPWTFAWAASKITILLGIVMFGMGMTLRFKDFKLIFQRPRDVLIGALAQFTIMPLIAFLIVKIFSLPPELAIGVMLVGTCPGGTSSNVMTYLAKGDIALSVSMTMLTTILSPVVTPLLMLLLAGKWIEISLSSMMISILQVVILPIALGITINATLGNIVKKFTKYLPLISILAIILIVGGVVSVNEAKIIEVGLMVAIVVIIHNLLGYGLGFVISKIMKMEISKAKAISIEVGMQNSGLSTSLAITHFGAAAAIPGAVFSVWHNISGSIVANYLSNKK